MKESLSCLILIKKRLSVNSQWFEELCSSCTNFYYIERNTKIVFFAIEMILRKMEEEKPAKLPSLSKMCPAEKEKFFKKLESALKKESSEKKYS